MTKIKVLEIIGDATLAGAPRHLLSLVENLDHDKFTIFVICPPGPLAAEIRSVHPKVELKIIPMRSKMDYKAISDIRKAIKEIKPDIIHVHGTRAGSVGRLAAIGFNLPVIYTEHLWTKHYLVPNRLLHWVQIFGLWFLEIFTTVNIAVSQAVKDFLLDSQISREDKVVVIYNGVEIPKKAAKIFDHDEVKIGTIGTLNIQKGIQYLIRALPQILKEYPKTTLEIIGDGPYRKDLENLTKKLKLKDKVKFTGFLNEVEDKLLTFDIYVQPSMSESFGLAIIQAMAVGIPIVATNTGGIPEVVTQGKSGILVNPGKPFELAKGILRLMRDHKKAKEMGHLASQDVKIKFSLEDMVSETEKLYELVKESPVAQ